MIKKTSTLAALLILFVSFLARAATLQPGTYRFEMKTTHGTIPFIMDVKKNKQDYEAVLKNGKEEINLDVQVKNKRVTIPLQTYEMTLEMEAHQDGTLSGFLVRHNKKPVVKTPVHAVQSSERFPQEKAKATIDLTGRWAVTLIDEEMSKKDPGVIVFDQKGNDLSGSILTPTGDYRYMEGYVSGNNFEAASFDGVYNYLVKGTVEDGKLTGNILSSYKTKLEGSKNDQAKLPDAYNQTQVEALNFEFPNLEGKKVSLKDPQFKGKPVIVQFFGSWCPNCMDEMNFLIPWYNENKKRGIEVVALAFERSVSPADAKKQLLKTQKKKNIPYPLLIAGSTPEDKPAEKIPGLKNFISFPTTVFLNKNHEVVKVHAGFTGPSTGEFYEKWKEEFNETVDGLLK